MQIHTSGYCINTSALNFTKYTTALTELVNHFSSSAVGIPVYKFSEWNLKPTWHNPALDICSVCVVVSESRECVELRLAARGDGFGRREMLDAVGTLLKGCEKFLEIWTLVVTLLRNSILSSSLWMSSSFFMDGKRLIRNMQSSSAWDFFILSLIFLFSKCTASCWMFIFLVVPRFFFTWRSSETPSLNSSLSLSLIGTFVEALPSSKFRLLPRTGSSAAVTFDSVGRYNIHERHRPEVQPFRFTCGPCCLARFCIV